MTETHLSTAFRIQAGACAALGSPFYGVFLQSAADDILADGPTLDLMTPWATSPTRKIVEDAAQLRFLGALHDLVLSGDAPDLAALYPAPGRAGDPERAWEAACAVIPHHRDRLAAFITHEPQTNEVRRSACLVPGFLAIADQTRLPLRCFELGASAGLNLNWDHYAYRFGDLAWGPSSSSVLIDTDWSGPAPAVSAPVQVIDRRACDRRPGDLNDPVQRRRLLAYIWPDQIDRLARLNAAMALGLALRVEVEAADALDWTQAHVRPLPGTTTVLYHSVFWQYLPIATQTALATTIGQLGEQATPDAPFAWLCMEPPHDILAGMQVRLTLWPGGQERVLATVHPHGAFVQWADQP